ncbi:CS1-pili formation C-terminal domain-containing protein [Acinetobacter rudis]|uniref:CS1-pili formation C-terminal domain-containing protein n=1 Tax=Acinetobacter rudis TaxID=632955 RepID=UPI00280F7D83|nr:CS1-pili formation C-terminal domain-containing protein [Acinetobacter rudis]MDQ8952888.1 CS1-pili formation C-terminal domain-containing protein [Acinetobacter rudis]
MNRPIVVGVMGILLTSMQNIYAEEKQSAIHIGKYTFPAALSSMLAQGFTVPVYLKFEEDLVVGEHKSQQKIADAVVEFKDNQLFIRKVIFDETNQKTELSTEVKDKIKTLDQAFDEDMQLELGPDASLTFDLKSLYLELKVNKSALGTKLIKRSGVLGESTTSNFSSILNYRLGASYSDFDSRTTSSTFVNLDSVSSIEEHHFIANGSFYSNDSETDFDLYRALYERDFEGNRLAVGMMDTWSMQSIASLSALNSSKIYGVTYGNKSSTVIEDKKQTLVPILVFLPSAGTIQVYRDGRLLSIQNFSMGSHELDTSTFPMGVYNVEVKTVINGQETSSSIAQVNKTNARQSSVTGQLSWQAFGGMLEYSKKRDDQEIKNNQKTWLMGVAAAKNYAYFSGVGLTSTLYGFDENFVAELESNIAFTSNTNFNFQSMLASDGSYRAGTSLSYNLPKGYANLWGAFDISEIGDKLYFTDSKNYSLGMSLNLNQVHRKLGMLTLNYSDDIKRDNSVLNVEYFQNLFTNRYVDMQVRMGLQRSDYDNQKNYNDKYIYFDLRLPFSRWFSAGINTRNKNILANASYKQNFSDQLINTVGIDVSQMLNRRNNEDLMDNFTASGYVGYTAKYNSGNLSMSASRNNYSVNYTSEGSAATSGKNLVLGNHNLSSGVIIETGLKDKGSMAAQINGQNYTLTGKNNFIPLAPYADYVIELMNDKTSIDSVSIAEGRKSRVTLYPGNVALLQPEVKQMVTIFGRVYYPNGELAANANIHNHIGKTKTDNKGEFSLDVDKRYPVLTLIEANGDICESTLQLEHARGAAWLGDVRCQYKPTSSLKNSLEAARHD